MLDLLPKSLWSNKNTTFLDPVSKTGVFLREIAKRLIIGLEKEIPSLEQRLNHIFTKQLYGIAITELTSLMSRRSLYCSKFPNEKWSVCNAFDKDNSQGNIFYKNIAHTFENGKCKFCGASRSAYDRVSSMESYAYNFIHLNTIKNIFPNMKFDVIIGNPPYQLSDKSGGQGSGASAIYHKFIQQAIKLQPNYISMIVKSDWTNDSTKGEGIKEFRNEIIKSNKISIIHNFPNSKDCFPQNEIDGGVNYFLWDNNFNKTYTDFYLHIGKDIFHTRRPLAENNNINLNYREIDYEIKNKILLKSKEFMSSSVSTRKPYGFDVLTEEELITQKGDLKCYSYKGIGFISKDKVTKNLKTINQYKVCFGKANGGAVASRQMIGKPFIAYPNEVLSETFLFAGCFDTLKEANNHLMYICTKFYRFMIYLGNPKHNFTQNTYRFVPIQDFNEPWDDNKLYKKYGLNKEEIEFIENTIKPMN
jgi:site-specific DNA-methyltransferase (adenine-specific)